MNTLQAFINQLSASNFIPRKFTYAPEGAKTFQEVLTATYDGGKIEFIADDVILRTQEFSVQDWHLAAYDRIRAKGFDGTALFNLYLADGDKKPGIPETVQSFDHVTTPSGFYQSTLGKKATKEVIIHLYENLSPLLDVKETKASLQAKIHELVFSLFTEDERATYQEILEKNKEIQALLDWTQQFAVGTPVQFQDKKLCVIFQLDISKAKAFGAFANSHNYKPKMFEFGTSGAKSPAKTWASFTPNTLEIGASNTTKPSSSIFETPETVLHVLLQIPQGFTLPEMV
jgi:hypothetical protein